MAEQTSKQTSRRPSDAALDNLLREIEEDALPAPARLPKNARLEGFVGSLTASAFFATQDAPSPDEPLEVAPIPLPPLRLHGTGDAPSSLHPQLHPL